MYRLRRDLPILPFAVVVSFVDDLTLVVIAATVVTSAVGGGDARADVPPHLTIGAGAAFRTDGFAVFLTQGNGPTRTLTIVYARFEDLTWRRMEGRAGMRSRRKGRMWEDEWGRREGE